MPALFVHDESVLIAALRSGTVPAEVAQAPVRCWKGREGIALEPSIALSGPQHHALMAAGFSSRPLPGAKAVHKSSWLEAVAPRRAADPRPPLAHVLFTRPAEGHLDLIGRLLQLGCDDQRFALYRDEAGDARFASNTKHPPYFLVLEAMERTDDARAYQPADPAHRLWIELGFEHPLAPQIHLPPNTWVLIDRDGTWHRLPAGPWRGMYETADFPLPSTQHPSPAEAPARFTVHLELVRSSRPSPAALWILRGAATQAVHELVATLPPQALDRFLYAPLVQGGERLVALRARKLGRESPPALDLGDEVQAYSPVAQVPELYAPEGKAVSPPLRPERLRSLLVTEPDCLVWLDPREGSDTTSFVPQAVPEAAFSPLRDWIDYVAETASEPLTQWISQVSFDFETFTTVEDPVASSLEKKPQRPVTDRLRFSPSGPLPAPSESAEGSTAETSPPEAAPSGMDPAAAVARPTPGMVSDLEQAILEHEGDPAEPTQVQRWVELAHAYGDAARRSDAALAWAHAQWEAPTSSSFEEGIARWLEQERGLAGVERFTPLSEPTRDQVRGVALEVIRGPQPSEPFLRSWLDEHRHQLDLRTFWFLAHRLFGPTEDELGRLRATDEVLERLRGGLPPVEVPGFVRADAHGRNVETTGDDTAGPAVLAFLTTSLRDLLAHYRTAERARLPVEGPAALTDGYAFWLFAWGFAQLGEGQTAQDLAAEAHTLHHDVREDPIHAFLHAALSFRLTEAEAGRSADAPLPVELRSQLDALSRFERYKVDRLREASVILDGDRSIDPFTRFGAPRQTRYAGLGDAAPDHIAPQVDHHLASEAEDDVAHAVSLAELLPTYLVSPRLPAMVARLDRVSPPLRVELLEATARIAARSEQREWVETLAFRLEALFDDEALSEPIAPILAIARLSQDLRHFELTGKIAEVMQEQLLRTVDGGPERAQDRLQIAIALAALGEQAPAEAAATEGLDALERVPVMKKPELRLARLVAVALSRLSPQAAAAGVRRLSTHLATITDSFNTNSHFCLSALDFTETLITGLARPDLSLSFRARRFIDRDEHRIRQRIFSRDP